MQKKKSKLNKTKAMDRKLVKFKKDLKEFQKAIVRHQVMKIKLETLKEKINRGGIFMQELSDCCGYPINSGGFCEGCGESAKGW